MNYFTAIDTQFGQTAEIESIQELEAILTKKEQGAKAKVKEKFYRLKNDEWLFVAKKLTHSELVVLYHLRTLEPWGDKLTESSTKEVAEATGISQRSVQRALIKLAELELIDLQIHKFAFRLRSKPAAKMTNSDSAVALTTPVSPARQECRVNVAGVASTSSLSDSSPETVTTSEFQISKTLKTYSDLLKTLSEGEREDFEKFCKKKIQESPFPIASNNAWLNKHGAEYLAQFQEMYSEAIANPQKTAPKAKPSELVDLAWIKKFYGDNWEAAAIHHGLILPNSPAVEIQQDTSEAEPRDTVDW